MNLSKFLMRPSGTISPYKAKAVHTKQMATLNALVSLGLLAENESPVQHEYFSVYISIYDFFFCNFLLEPKKNKTKKQRMREVMSNKKNYWYGLMLLCDGHGSHFMPDAISRAAEKG